MKPSAEQRLVEVNHRLRRFNSETRLPAYKATEIAEIVKEISAIVLQYDAECREQVERARTTNKESQS